MGLVLLGACTGRSAPEPTVPSSSAASQPGALDCPDAALLGAPVEASAVFPDDPVAWTARPVAGGLGDLVLVSLTPDPQTFAHPEVRFVYRCDVDGPRRLAVYVLEGEGFVLLSTTEAVGGEELPEELP